ncbi:MAG: tRNA (N6-threonylcarbamoyladenosine(37)-N6)-methyltransferase TrmO [Theionarchaea archaeon]|nr:tRNA (N6-threonylcarbamoyladenosine(37)-N6)-methyltransferase TrmO [Theionarchaea archaeon]
MLHSISLRPIGTVKNDIHERPETWKDVVSEIHIDPELEDALSGIEEFSHLLIIFYFHLSSECPLKLHPRGNPDLPLTGVFATRAPVRPNPIGASIVELLTVSGNVLTVKGLDTYDSTPVLDIKPHLSDHPPERLPSWVNR